ncbi:NUDIX domain-containing protein [Actinomycetospora aeridis]|uniref:NUDIX domain-containing protein n=1 Tax=Actinomycetospora aeridis TaxID=3129231 RepID=A0ABU8N8X0_9PSEU
MEVIARAVVVRDGALLLMRGVTETFWFFPGGHVEAGETPEIALHRELREELGAAATVDARLGELENTWSDGGVAHHEVNHVFVVTLDVRDPVSQEPELVARWHRLEDLDATDARPRALVDLIVPQVGRR